VAWLAAGLRRWVWPQESWPSFLRKGDELGLFAHMDRARLGRSRLVIMLKKEVPGATNILLDLISNWPVMSFLSAESFEQGFGPIEQTTLVKLLRELDRRCAEVSRSAELVTAKGKAKGGRNKPLAPQQIDEKLACASAIAVAWELARGEPPGPLTAPVKPLKSSLRWDLPQSASSI
jgi:hypothetical protein